MDIIGISMERIDLDEIDITSCHIQLELVILDVFRSLLLHARSGSTPAEPFLSQQRESAFFRR
jgi:hypothetical protein